MSQFCLSFVPYIYSYIVFIQNSIFFPGICFDRSNETEAQIKAEIKAKNAGSTYVNAFEEEAHNYENTRFNNNGGENLDDQDLDDEIDEIQTVHSEGVGSEAPPLPAKNGLFVQQGEEGGLVVMPDQDSSSSEMYSLGDISEADERVKKFYGLIPKNGPMAVEIKTVRMVKRDSKERSVILY